MTEVLTGRLNFRLTPEQEQALRQAAAVTGQSLTGFVLSSAVEHAHEVLARANTVELSDRAFRRFVAVLDEPAEEVPELARLFRRPSRIPARVSRARLRPVEHFDPSRHVVDHFDSGVTPLDDWLRRTAAIAAAAGTAATWVLCRGQVVVGYYALAMGSVARAGTPSRLGRGQPDPIPVVLLARLALDRTEQGRGLGADLLRDALVRAVAGARAFGARAVVVDAIDESAGAFYRHHGFLPLDGRRLYRRIADIERAMGR